MKRIESPKNERVKQWKKLLTKKGRDKTNLFLIEGFHLVEEAIKSGVHIEELIVAEHAIIPVNWNIAHIPMTIVTDEVIKAISDTETPQGIAAVCKQLHWNIDDIQTALFIDAVQDPELRTIIRTADAAGIDAVVVGEGSADIYNAKVIRATQGSVFHFPVIKGDIGQWIARFQNKHIPIYGTSLQNG
ncbi:23S rRNA (uridine(2479)-2'-O)-methyltransferase [Anoxybacillus sp. BCO1]|nr:23S rRNA (uridine(2479)-2'-O)-methyltransferase [Anoxybacillus sp. BCO1]